MFSKNIINRLDLPERLKNEVLVTYRTANIAEPSVTFPGNEINISGKLEDKSKSGTVWLYIFDDNVIFQESIDEIPQWIKKNANWWSKGTITDSDFLRGIEYLIQIDILKIEANKVVPSSSKEIPHWIRHNAEWWATGLISDNEFIAGIKYLIEAGIISYR